MQEDNFYINDEGLLVFTEKFHRERGFCCGRGCKHCPYEYENVPEVKRAKLLAARKANEENRGR